jgi:hypothetical protein
MGALQTPEKASSEGRREDHEQPSWHRRKKQIQVAVQFPFWAKTSLLPTCTVLLHQAQPLKTN